MNGDETRKRIYQKIKKLEAYREIQNLMGRTVIAYNFRQKAELAGFFSKVQADISIEVADEGVFQGKEAVEAYIKEYIPQEGIPGEMMDIHLASPIIEVADDVKTAKAQWVCPGIGALPRENNEPLAIWNWGIIAADFTYEEGEWKIWHLHWFRLMKCDYDKGWVKDTSMENRLNKPYHPLAKPTTYHNPYTPYSIRECIPAIPRPYVTWDNSDWMLNKNRVD
ncbi:MAG TPA: nuclear transport factor 2 family protein [Clostridiales bacterium]|nr:nuclear transport factor 2 family protein [Clostridiales bacterium]